MFVLVKSFIPLLTRSLCFFCLSSLKLIMEAEAEAESIRVSQSCFWGKNKSIFHKCHLELSGQPFLSLSKPINYLAQYGSLSDYQLNVSRIQFLAFKYKILSKNLIFRVFSKLFGCTYTKKSVTLVQY